MNDKGHQFESGDVFIMGGAYCDFLENVFVCKNCHCWMDYEGTVYMPNSWERGVKCHLMILI